MYREDFWPGSMKELQNDQVRGSVFNLWGGCCSAHPARAEPRSELRQSPGAGLQAKSERRGKVKGIKRNYTIKHSESSSVGGTWNAFLKCHSKLKYCINISRIKNTVFPCKTNWVFAWSELRPCHPQVGNDTSISVPYPISC